MNSDQTKTYIVYITLGLSVLVIIGLFFFNVPEKNKDLLNIVIGSLIGWTSAIVSFYFGNSEQNKEKKREL